MNVNYIIKKLNINRKELLLPFHAIRHPIDAFETMKYEKTGSVVVNGILVLIWLISEVLLRKNRGFIFNNINPDTVNIFDIISGTFAIFVIILIANLLLCIFMEAEGTGKQVFSFMSYAVLILTFYNIGMILLTSILSIEMASFILLYSMCFYVWIGVYIFTGLMTVHQFGFSKTIKNIFLTLLGALLIAGLIFLLYSLYQQVASFFYTIYNEMIFRIF